MVLQHLNKDHLLISLPSLNTEKQKGFFSPTCIYRLECQKLYTEDRYNFLLLHIKLYKIFHIKDILLSHFQHLLTFLQLGCTKGNNHERNFYQK